MVVICHPIISVLYLKTVFIMLYENKKQTWNCAFIVRDELSTIGTNCPSLCGESMANTHIRDMYVGKHELPL